MNFNRKNIVIGKLGLFFIVVLLNSCIARFFVGEAVVMRSAVSRLSMTEMFVINGERMVIANDAMFSGALRRVFVRNRVLYLRESGGVTRTIGTVTSKRTLVIEGQNVVLPNDIYTLRSGKVNIRSSLGNDSHFKVFQHQESGQVVLKLYERQGYAYIQYGVNEFGWVLLGDILLVSNEIDKIQSSFSKCNFCKQTGHSIQHFECNLCKGSGHINCLYCKGYGNLPCYTCKKSGFIFCDYCQGIGAVNCESCLGRGYILDVLGNKSSCDRCQSSGKHVCYDCNGNAKAECTICTGQGFYSCNQCYGSGFAICYRCFESGYFSADIQCQHCMGTGWIRIK